MKWIKCSDRLPHEFKTGDEPVIIFTKYGISLDKITHPKDGNLWECTDKNIVTHWANIEIPKD